MASGTRLGSVYWQMGVDRSDFDRGLQDAERQVQQFGQQASHSFSALTVAAGALLAQGISKVAAGLRDMAGSAIQATADYQAMQVGMEGLLAREIARGQEMTRTRQVSVKVQAEEIKNLEELQLKHQTLGARINEQKERIRQLTEKWGEQGLTVITNKARLAEMEQQYGALGQKINATSSETTKLISVTEKYRINTMTLSEAMPQAQERAKGLMNELARIAILSPYQVQSVQQTFKMAMAFGYTADEAKKFTGAILNVAAGTGATNEMLDRMAYNFAQIRMQGKVTAVDMRQLAMAGFDLNGVLESVGQQFGVTINSYEDFNDAIASGKITWQQFTDGFAKYADENFGGASERMSKTLNGLKSTFKDVFMLTFPQVLGPAAEQVTGFLSGILDGFLKIRDTGILEEIGQRLGTFTENAISGLQRTVDSLGRFGLALRTAFQAGGIGNVVDYLGMLLKPSFDDLPGKVAEFGERLRTFVHDLFYNLLAWWDEGGGAELVTGTLERVGNWLHNTLASLGTAGGDIQVGLWEWIGNLWGSFKTWWDAGGGELVIGVLEAVGRFLEAVLTGLWEMSVNFATRIAEWLGSLWGNLVTWWQTGGQEQTTATLAALGAWFEGVMAQLGAQLADWGGKVMAWAGELWGNLITWWQAGGREQTATGIGDAIGQMLGGLIDFLFITLPEWGAKLFEWIGSLFTGESGSMLANLMANIGAFAQDLGVWIWEMLSQAWASILENSEAAQQIAANFDVLLENIKAGVKWAEKLIESGKQLIEGMKTGISQMPDAVKTHITDFITTNVTNAVDWVTTLFDAGKDLIRGFINGIADMGDALKNWIVGWIKEHVPQPIWDFFDMESPSKLMAETGRMVMAGLARGFEEGGRQAQGTLDDTLRALLDAGEGFGDTLRSVFDAWPSITDALRSLASGPPADVTPFLNEWKRQIVQVVRMMAMVWRNWTDKAIFDDARTAADLVTQLFEPWEKIIAAVKGLAEGPADVVPTLAAWHRQIVNITKMLGMVWRNWTDKAIFDDAKAASEVVGAVFAPWEKVQEAVKAIAAGPGLDMVPMLDDWRRQIVALVQTLRLVAVEAGPGVLDAAAEAAQKITEALSPWQSLLTTYSAFADVAIRYNVGAKAEAVKDVTWSLIRKITWLANSIGDDILARSAEVAEKITTALSPWQVMLATVSDFADFTVTSGVGQKAEALKDQVWSLIRKVAWLANSIGDDILERTSAVAGQITTALSPWKAMIDAAGALADFAVASGLGPKAEALKDQVMGLVRKIAWLANEIGDDILERAADTAAKITAALSPWKAMIQTAEAVATAAEVGNLDDKAGVLTDAVKALALALGAMADRIGKEVLEKAAMAGKLLQDVLRPWEAAIRLADEMRAWRMMPDLEERFTRFARQWVNIVADLEIAVRALTGEGLELVAEFGETLESLIGGLRDALELALALPATWTDPPSWAGFVSWVRDAFMEFYHWLNGWASEPGGAPIPIFPDGALDIVGQFASALTSLMAGLRAALDLALALPETWAEPPSWDAFSQWVRDAFMEFYDWLESWLAPSSEPGGGVVPVFDGEPLNVVGLFGDALGSLMAGLMTALELALALPETWTEPPSWDAFSQWVQDAFVLFNDWVLENFPPPDDPNAPDQFGAIAGFSGALSALMGGLASAMDVALALPETWEVNEDVWDDFTGWVQDTFVVFNDWAIDNFPPPDDPEAPDQFGVITGFGDALGSLMAGLSAALDLALALPETWAEPDQEMWDAFFGWVTQVFDAFVTYVNDNYPTTPEEAPDFAPVQAFGDAMGAVFSGLVSALELFAGLANWAGPSSTFNTRLANFLGAVLDAFNQISDFVADNINPDDFQPVEDFGNALGALVGGLSDALDLFAQLADTDPTVYTESTLFQDRVGNLLQSIGGTLAAFREWILGPNGLAWATAAQTFYTAVSSVFSTLRDGLNLFIDLATSGMPPTPQIQAFVTAITDLFAAVGTSLGGLAQPGGALTTAIAAVEDVIDGFPTTIGTYQDEWWTAMGNLGGEAVAGLYNKLGTPGGGSGSTTLWGVMGRWRDALYDWAVGVAAPGATLQRWWEAGVAFGEELIAGLLSLTGEGGEMWQAGYALAQAGLDGFNAGAGLGEALAGMGEGLGMRGLTLDTSRRLTVEFVGAAGSPDGVDLSYHAVDQITAAIVERLNRGG